MHINLIKISDYKQTFLYKYSIIYFRDEPIKEAICSTACGISVWLGACIALKYSLRALFLYKGWYNTLITSNRMVY